MLVHFLLLLPARRAGNWRMRISINLGDRASLITSLVPNKPFAVIQQSWARPGSRVGGRHEAAGMANTTGDPSGVIAGSQIQVHECTPQRVPR